MTTFTSLGTMSKAVSMAMLIALATAQGSLNALVYKGCYTSAGDMTDYGSYTYQTPGYCQQQCVNAGKAVMGNKGGSDCYCGDQLPDPSDKTSDSSCNTKCNGFGSMNCGGSNSWSVQLTGTNYNPGSVSDSSSSSSSNSKSSSGSQADSDSDSDSSDSSAPSAAPSSADPPASSAPAQSQPAPKPSPAQGNQPSVVTHASTIVVTAPGQTQAETTVVTTTETASKKGPNVAGIAAGVVVGVVALAAIIGVLFFVLRLRKRRMVEELHRNSIGTSTWYGSKPHNSSASNSVSDSRLEPSVMMQRRHSDASIADNQDYSRRILKVTNPDGS